MPRAPLFTAITLAGLLVAGCNSTAKRDVAGWLVADPTQRHPIVVDQKEVVLDIAVPRGSYGLTHNQKADLRAFAQQFRSDDSGGVLVVRAPNGGPNEIAAMRAMDDVRRTIVAAGVPRGQAVYESYYGGGVPDAPIRVSFMRHVAVGPECGDWSDNLARDPKNMPYRNLGCATQKNLAAMVSNPRDLIEPRGYAPRSSERRDVIWDKYIKGETTTAK
ncbi:MAG: pilus assembly protein CpaD, partial [Alphaproteobacteria bacterium]